MSPSTIPARATSRHFATWALALGVVLLPGCRSCATSDVPAEGENASSASSSSSGATSSGGASSSGGGASSAASASSSASAAASSSGASSSGGVTLTRVDLTPSAPTLATGTQVQMAATAVFSDGSTVDATAGSTWTSSDAAVATVTNGLLVAVGAGTATITATYQGVAGTTPLTVSSATLQSIAVTPGAPSLAAGTQVQLVATGIFSDGSSQDLSTVATWASSAVGVASVDGTGNVLGVTAGTADITATLSGVTGTVTVTVTAATLVSIVITPGMPTAAAGTALQLQATGTFSDGTTQDLSAQVSWSVDDTNVAVVTVDGLINALAAGTATVSAALGTAVASVMLTVTSATLVSITVTPSVPVLVVGDSLPLVATGVFSDNSTQDLTQSVTWSSSDAAVATVSNAVGSEGALRALAAGTSVITAAQGGVSGTAQLTVSAATLVSLAVAPQLPNAIAGTTVPFTATATYSDGTTRDVTAQVTWTSSDNTVAVVSNTAGSEGSVNAVGVGTASITASLSGVSDTTVITVNAATLQRIDLEPLNPTTAVGLTQVFSAMGTYSDGSVVDISAQVTWSSSDAAVATISNAQPGRGTATALTVGTTTITATLGMVDGSTTLTVLSAVITSIAVTPATSTLARGSSTLLVATATFSDGTTLDVTTSATWSSSDPLVVTVSNALGAEGEVTAVSPGQATITATLGTVSGTATVRATQAVLVSIELRPGAVTLALNTSQQFTAFGSFSDGSTRQLGQQITWATADTAVATVSTQGPTRGTVSAVAAGNTSVTATQDGVTGTAPVSVTDAALTSITLSPATTSVPLGYRVRIRATGNFSDASTQDITQLCTWSSSDAAVAAVSNNTVHNRRGTVSSLSAGTTTITATLGTISATAAVTVVTATLQSVAITPNPVAVTVGNQAQATATGTFTGGLTLDLTEQSAWTTADGAVAAVANGPGRQGRVTGVAAGSTTITATSVVGAIAGTGPVNVTAP